MLKFYFFVFLFRCIALSSLGIFLYEELTHGTLHPKLKEATNVLLGALKVSVQFSFICCF